MLRKGSGFPLYLFLADGQKKDAAAILNARAPWNSRQAKPRYDLSKTN
jgi:hypothetical protein